MKIKLFKDVVLITIALILLGGCTLGDVRNNKIPPYNNEYEVDHKNDLTSLFLSIHAQVKMHQAGTLPLEARHMRFRFVKGFRGNHIDGYMEDTVQRLAALGLDSRFIEIATEGGFEDNIRKIQKVIEESTIPVVLIGHSRGGVMVHDAYRRAPEKLKAKVARLVLMQASLRGSEVADWELGFPQCVITLPVLWSYGIFGRPWGWGNVLESTRELSTTERGTVMGWLEREYPLSELDLKKIYVLYSSFDPDINKDTHKDMLFSRRMMEKRIKAQNHPSGGRGDGLVGVYSAQLPGANFIFLHDVDHEDTVLREASPLKRLLGSRPNPNFAAGDIAETLLRLIFYGGSDVP